MKTDTDIEYMPLQYIPTKSPDVPPMDYCDFRRMKKKKLFSKYKPYDWWTLESSERRMPSNTFGNFTKNPSIVKNMMQSNAAEVGLDWTCIYYNIYT